MVILQEPWYRIVMEILSARAYYQQANMTKKEYTIPGMREKVREKWFTPVYQRMIDVEGWMSDKGTPRIHIRTGSNTCRLFTYIGVDGDKESKKKTKGFTKMSTQKKIHRSITNREEE